MSEPVRLAKRVAELARCSRIAAEQYIKCGWVRVDGRVVEIPHLLVTDEAVSIDAEKNAISHRGNAFRLLTPILRAALAGAED